MCSINSSPGGPTATDMPDRDMPALDRRALELDRARRVADAELAWFVAEVEAAGTHRTDGHRTVTAWVRAACNASASQAIFLARLGRALRSYPTFAAQVFAGNIAVGHLQAFARTNANPRVAHLLQHEAPELLPGVIDAAVVSTFDDFAVVLARLEALADPADAHLSHETIHHRRRASVGIIDGECFVRAVGGVAQGLLISEIFERFVKAEWQADWDEGVAVHGESMRPRLMARTQRQRSFDALHHIFRAAAGSGVLGGEVVVNLLVDQSTFEAHLTSALGGPLHNSAAADRADARCESSSGHLVDPADVVVAACLGHVRRVVLDSAGVIVDLGRKQRLFTGVLRDAVLGTHRRCLWPGCRVPASSCEVDHLQPWSLDGPTAARNAGPVCSHHNRWKNKGYRTWRETEPPFAGWWHVHRSNGTQVGWSIHSLNRPSHPYYSPAA
jgi:hypothetical protein